MMSESESPISDALRTAIQESGITLAALERETGVQRKSVALFLRGEQSLRLDIADRLAAYFGLIVVQPQVQDARVKVLQTQPIPDDEIGHAFRDVAFRIDTGLMRANGCTLVEWRGSISWKFDSLVCWKLCYLDANAWVFGVRKTFAEEHYGIDRLLLCDGFEFAVAPHMDVVFFGFASTEGPAMFLYAKRFIGRLAGA